MRVDEIAREIVLDAPVERVWAALTEADQLRQWFGDIATLDLRPGGVAVFGWSEFDSVSDAVVEIVEKPKRFAFRWQAVKDTPVEEVSTLVEFTLEPEGTGTKLVMVESGFSTLSEDVYDDRLRENSSGWDAELSDLAGFLEGANVG